MFKLWGKKFLAVVSVMVFVTFVNAITLSASAVDSVEEKSIPVVFDESIPEGALEQESALLAYDILMHSPGFDDNVEHPSYPDDFGGYFIGEDNRLHVQYVGDNIEKYATIFPSLDSVVLEQVDYSYNELQKLADFAFTQSNSIIEAYVDTKANQAAVGVQSGSEKLAAIEQDISTYYMNNREKTMSAEITSSGLSDLLSGLKKNVKSPLKIYEASTSEVQSELWGGDKITGNGHAFTLGSIGYYQGSPAIVTCGHGLKV